MSERELSRTLEKPVNIGSQGETETEQVLSNFAATPFVLDGQHYASVEGFWQSLKFPEGSREREEVSQMVGREAKRTGRQAPRQETFRYLGQEIRVGSPEHHELMRRAIRAKLEQNLHVLKLLLATGNRPITHILKAPDGRVLPDSKTIPGAIFS